MSVAIARRLVRRLVAAPVLALALQLLATAVAAAASGGGDFPLWRR